LQIRIIKILPCETRIVFEYDYSPEESGINWKNTLLPGYAPGSISVILDSGEALTDNMAVGVSAVI